ncbi:MAG: DUF1552 domain-containing protein [Polyangiaceae bacterium]
MPNFRLSRRAVIRGAGSIAIALPWLEIMLPERPAHAASASRPANHFLAVFQPGGTVRSDAKGVDKWAPTGTETSFTLSPILAPLAPIQKKLLIVDGPDMLSAVGEQHQAGIIAFLTGSTQASNNGTLGYATGPSIDQVIAKKLYNKDLNKKKSIQLAVRWATGKSHGSLSPINCVNFDADNNSPIGPVVDPQVAWKDLFGSLGTDSSGQAAAAAALKRKQSILDFVDKRYTTLAGRLGAADKLRLQEHLSKIRDLESSLQAVTTTSSTCSQVPAVSTSDYNPHPAFSDDGSVVDGSTDAAIPKVGKFMMDMMVMSFACNIAPVGTLQWSDTEAKHTFPWLNLNRGQHHHFYQHDGGFQPAECEAIGTWYSTQHLYLLQALDKVVIGDHTLLDETVVFFGSELQEPPTHKKGNMPFFLGGGGGLNTGTGGRWIKKKGESHNDLLVSILNLFGDPRTTFGTAQYCKGPMTGIV